MVYMDNASTSWPKPYKVTEEMNRCLLEYCANPGRGGHKMAIKCGMEIYEARKAISRLFNIDNPLRICFTKNTTEALNLGIRGFLKEGCHVVTTGMEHNSVVRPLTDMQKKGVRVTIVYGEKNGAIDPNRIEESITNDTRMVICTMSSNVNGIILPVKSIGEICRRRGAAFMVDAAQGAGSIKIDVADMKIDLLAFPGHKGLLGPQGTGGLYIGEGIDLEPLGTGGTGSSSLNVEQPDIMPDKMESGTLNTPGIVGLRQGVEFIESIGLENLEFHKRMILEKLCRGLERINGITLYSSPSNNSGIVALNMEGMDPNYLGCILNDRYNIAARAGLHCAPLAHKTLGTLPHGLLRLSPGCFTTYDDADYVIEAFKHIASNQSRI
jgi:cysteine desulfurase/selenocysteine lyase